MTIHPPKNFNIADWGHHCAGCTERIPAEAKWYLALYQLKGNDGGYTIVAKYVCPRCHSITEHSFRTGKSNRPFMDYINLYTHTRRGNSLQEDE